MFAHLARQSKLVVISYGVLLVALVSLADYLTGGHHSVLILYTLPVCLVSWFAGRRSGALMAALCAIGWLVSDVLSGFASNLHYWNAVMRYGVFLMLALFTGSLAASTRRKDQLLQFIVHDLRSPLTNVLTGLETLRALPDQPSELHRELTDMATVSANRVLSLVNSMLDLSKLEHHAMKLTLECEVEPGLDQVHADADITVRVLVNLASNALKYSPRGGVIRLRAARSGGNVVFSVRDQGPGIPKEWLSRIFDPYAQVEPGGRSGVPATGLGLTFCQLAVKAQRGRIWIESEVGKGTTVLFTLPASTRSEPKS
jgi:signal transduction histidine kinase